MTVARGSLRRLPPRRNAVTLVVVTERDEFPHQNQGPPPIGEQTSRSSEATPADEETGPQTKAVPFDGQSRSVPESTQHLSVSPQQGQHPSRPTPPPGYAPFPIPTWRTPAHRQPQGTGYGDDTRMFRALPQQQAPQQPPQHGHPQQPGPPRQPPPGGPGPGQWNYVEPFRAEEPKAPAGRGWRRAVFKATFGLINLGPSPDEVAQAELEAKVRTLLRGHYKIGVLGKGGVGKTSVAVSVGSLLAELRQEDRVVAIDADTAFGKLGARVDPNASGSYWELAADQHLHTFADIRSRVGKNAAGLFVLAGESNAARRRVLDPAIYREATSRLDRHFTIVIVDCGSTLDSGVTQEAIRDLDALIVVSSPWADGASAAGQTMEWLANRGLSALLQRTVVVLNDSDGHADKRTRAVLAQQFGSRGQVVIQVPFDPHLRPGGVIDVKNQMAPRTRRGFLEIAAAIGEHFSETNNRPQEPRPR
jgi:MinD-like ATPase involved in chromosome partitioning or flagellar assembly